MTTIHPRIGFQSAGPTRPPREHFIPLRKTDLVRLLAADQSLAGADRQQFLALCRMLEATFHFEYHQRLEALKDSYAPFDPDADTRFVADSAPKPDHAAVHVLFEQLAELLQRANFRRLDRTEIEEALADNSDWAIRLDVDFDVFERLEIFSRGETIMQRQRRRRRNFFRREQVELPIYQRLVVAFRLRQHRRLGKSCDTHPVYLKIFKDIPKMDLEMLLPGTRVRMTLLDQCRIMLPTISGLVLTIVKIVKGALALTLVSLYGLLGFLGLVGGTLGYGIKSFFGYLRTKDKYQLNLTKNLYFQNLDNNAGVLFRLLDEVEEQEFREAILAYYLLWRHAPPTGWTEQELDDRAETYLRTAVGLDVDFEVDDALQKLQRLGLTRSFPGGRFAAIPIDQSLVNLDRAWDSYFQYAASSHAFGNQLQAGRQFVADDDGVSQQFMHARDAA